MIVGTRDADRVPEVSRGWGVRVLPESDTLEERTDVVRLDHVGRGRLRLSVVRPVRLKVEGYKGAAHVSQPARGSVTVLVRRLSREQRELLVVWTKTVMYMLNRSARYERASGL